MIILSFGRCLLDRRNERGIVITRLSIKQWHIGLSSGGRKIYKVRSKRVVLIIFITVVIRRREKQKPRSERLNLLLNMSVIDMKDRELMEMTDFHFDNRLTVSDSSEGTVSVTRTLHLRETPF